MLEYLDERIPQGGARAVVAELVSETTGVSSATYPGPTFGKAWYGAIHDVGGIQAFTASPEVTTTEVPGRDATLKKTEKTNNLSGSLTINSWNAETLKMFLGADVSYDASGQILVINQYKGATKKEFGLWILRNETDIVNEKELFFAARVSAGEIPLNYENQVAESLEIPITMFARTSFLDNINPDGRFPLNRTDDNLFWFRAFGASLALPTNSPAGSPAVSAIEYFNGSTWAALDSATPAANAVLRVTFDENVIGAEDLKNVSLLDGSSNAVAMVLTYDQINKQLTISPKNQGAGTWTLTLGTGIQDLGGVALSATGNSATYTIS